PAQAVRPRLPDGARAAPHDRARLRAGGGHGQQPERRPSARHANRPRDGRRPAQRRRGRLHPVHTRSGGRAGRARMMAAPFALYVHVPYCRHVCPYCDFNVYASAAPPDGEYVRTLLTELETWTAGCPWTGRPLATVYLGGGTPSLFSPSTLGV